MEMIPGPTPDTPRQNDDGDGGDNDDEFLMMVSLSFSRPPLIINIKNPN